MSRPGLEPDPAPPWSPPLQGPAAAAGRGVPVHHQTPWSQPPGRSGQTGQPRPSPAPVPSSSGQAQDKARRQPPPGLAAGGAATDRRLQPLSGTVGLPLPLLAAGPRRRALWLRTAPRETPGLWSPPSQLPFSLEGPPTQSCALGPRPRACLRSGVAVSTPWQSRGECCPSGPRRTAHGGLRATGGLRLAIGLLRSSHPASASATQASLSPSWTCPGPRPGGLGPARQGQGALGQGPDLQGMAGDAEADSGCPLSWATLSLPLRKGAGVTHSGIPELAGEAGAGRLPAAHLGPSSRTGLDGGGSGLPTPAGEQWLSGASCPLGGVRRGSVHPGFFWLSWFCPLPLPAQEGEKYPELSVYGRQGGRCVGGSLPPRPPPGASRHVN